MRIISKKIIITLSFLVSNLLHAAIPVGSFVEFEGSLMTKNQAGVCNFERYSLKIQAGEILKDERQKFHFSYYNLDSKKMTSDYELTLDSPERLKLGLYTSSEAQLIYDQCVNNGGRQEIIYGYNSCELKNESDEKMMKQMIAPMIAFGSLSYSIKFKNSDHCEDSLMLMKHYGN